MTKCQSNVLLSPTEVVCKDKSIYWVFEIVHLHLLYFRRIVFLLNNELSNNNIEKTKRMLKYVNFLLQLVHLPNKYWTLSWKNIAKLSLFHDNVTI